jgi:Raf kinase inhibitor-like YbhB/YbcL family protein
MVVMEDLNAPGGVFIHWVLYDVPPNVTQIPEGLPAGFYIPGIGIQGVNDFGRIGYGGPCPPPGPPHEYVVVVLALKTVIKPLPNVSDRYLLSLLNESDVVGYGILIGYYGG